MNFKKYQRMLEKMKKRDKSNAACCPRCGKEEGMNELVIGSGAKNNLGSEPCEECKKELAEYREVVQAGGAYVRCEKCGREGVITKEGISEQFPPEVVVDIEKRRNEHGVVVRLDCPQCRRRNK